jgi:hypothetical protein
MTSRRSFLAAGIAASAAAMELDPERGLWVRGRRVVSVPRTLARERSYWITWKANGIPHGDVAEVSNQYIAPAYQSIRATIAKDLGERFVLNFPSSFRGVRALNPAAEPHLYSCLINNPHTQPPDEGEVAIARLARELDGLRGFDYFELEARARRI